MFFVLDEIASFAFSLDILFKRQVMQSYSLSLIENLARLLRVVLRKISARSRTSECGDCWTTVRSEGGKAELARPPPSVSGYRDNWPWMCRVQRRSRRRPSTIRPVSFHVRYSRRKTRSALGSASCTILIREFAEEEILNYERKVWERIQSFSIFQDFGVSSWSSLFFILISKVFYEEIYGRMGFRKLYILKFKNASSNLANFKREEFEKLKSILKSCLWTNRKL